MNNRIIKFRAWVKKYNKIAGVYTLGLSGIEHTKINVGGELFSGCGKDDIEIMQFTGLYDKNEKEIYEGDVIKTSNKIIFTVEIPNIFYKMANGAWSEYDFEIIGNVYQNPDLLVNNKK